MVMAGTGLSSNATPVRNVQFSSVVIGRTQRDTVSVVEAFVFIEQRPGR